LQIGSFILKAKFASNIISVPNRLRHLGLRSFTQYHEFLLSPQGTRDEIPFMVNAVTTNKTDFFREPHQFDFLTKHTVPECCGRMA
jgi:chemotaxis methyl-accepting protein methylase